MAQSIKRIEMRITKSLPSRKWRISNKNKIKI